MSPRLKIPAVGIASLCLLSGVWWIHQHGDDSAAFVAGKSASLKNLTATAIEGANATERPLTIRPVGGAEPLVVALDEFCLKNAEGILTLTKLDPPATDATLKTRLAAFADQGEPLPLAYPDGAERTETNRRLVTNQLRVQVADNEADALAASSKLEIADRPDYAPGWVILKAADPLAALAVVDQLRASSAVTAADVLLGRKFSLKTLPNDPLVTQQWHLKKTASSAAGTDINVEDAWKYGTATGVKGAGIRIGIIDDGLETAHPDLAANVDLANSKDWIGGDLDPNPMTDDDHGTACAGVAAARGNNGIGVSGVAPEAKLVGLRLVEQMPTDQQQAEAFAWKNDIIQVKSNSWGPYDSGTTLDSPEPLTLAAFASAAANGRSGKGTVFVWAGGNGKAANDNSNYDGWANSIYTIAVGAIDSTGASSYYSESGANILVVAPSNGSSTALGITTVDRTGAVGYESGDYTSDFGGTSSATPVVSGVAALMLEKNPELGWRDVQEILFRSATQFAPTDSGWKTNGAGFKFNHKFGGGLVNANAAVNMAATWTNLPAQTSLALTDSTNVAIPNNNTAGVSKTFTFSATDHRVEKVTVKLSATHSYRGNLNVTLTSPSNMVSQLAEVHADGNPNYSNWVFSSVQHWGETAAGNWTVTVSDRSNTGNTAGGTLGAVTVTLFGSSTAPVNPPPTVQITSPVADQIFSPDVPITVAATASDLALGGGPGSVSQVELFVDGVSAGVDTSSPYQFGISPAVGSHNLQAKATDTVGAIGSSSVVAIQVMNQPPVISAVTLSSVGQGYSDTPLSVSAVTASDPEGTPLTYSYQWQSSTDGSAFANVSGRTSAILPVASGNESKLWRCIVTASDGVNSSAPFTTAAVNLLLRPATIAKTGSAYSYSSGLVLKGVQETLTRQAIINEFSQGALSGGSSEWVEILVLKTGSLASWQLKNATSNVTFKNVALWTNVPAGTLIVVYNGGARDSLMPADDLDASDGRIIVGSNNASYFSTTNWIPLTNNNGVVSLGLTAAVHTVSWGTNGAGTPVIGAVGNLQAAYFSTGSEAAANLTANWAIQASNVLATTANPYVGVTPGAANTAANQTFITKLRTNSLTETPPFRIGAGADIPAGLTLNTATGVLSGTISPTATVGDHLIVIERYNSLNEIVSQSYTLRIAAANYSQWIGGYTVSSNAANGDPDGDGLPNLVEYLLDGDPRVPQFPAPIAFASDASAISLTYRQSKIPTDATLTAEWAVSLDAGTVWQSTGFTTSVLDENAASKLLKVSLPISAADPKRFLRLRATLAP